MKPLLRDLPIDQFPDLLAVRGHPTYRGRQLAHWLFARDAFTWEAMSNLPRAMKESLSGEFDVAGLSPLERLVGTDGTRKFLFALRDGHYGGERDHPHGRPRYLLHF